MYDSSINWQAYHEITVHPDEPLQSWLLHTGSFIERLAEFGLHHPEIQVLQEDWLLPLPNESSLLNLSLQTKALIREVKIMHQQRELMWARTVFSPEILLLQPHLQNLKNRSLGSILFKNPEIIRSAFSFARLGQEQHWGRYSIFTLNKHSLLLTEVFLPAMQTIC